MTDIVQRLRDLARYSPVDATKDDCLEAADEIERLREIVKAEGVEIERLCGEAEAIPRWVRNDALEEAAKVADARRPQNSHRHSSQYAEMSDVIAREIAAAVRALKEKAGD